MKTSAPAFLLFSSIAAAACALPAVVAGCGGNAFSTGSSQDDASLGPDSDIIIGPDASPHHDGGMHDATMPGDAAHDAPHEGSQHDGEAGPPDSGPGDTGPAEGAPPTDSGMDVDSSPGCPTGYLDCAGNCVPDDVLNCGTCGHNCTNLAHVSGATCGTGGVCTFTNANCATGWAHCTSNPDQGCETNIGVSPNCGGCNVNCTGNTPVCDGTGCVSGCSGTTPTLCNGTTCVNTTNDPQNCNTCNNICPAGPAHSQPTCASSACSYACDTSYTGCPTAAPTECDDLTNDPSNCGACGNVCAITDPPPAHATPNCNGTCGWTCDTNYLKCNGNSCLLQAPDTTAGVFVAQGGPTSSCGSIGVPCGTISAGLTAAQQLGGKSIVYLAESATPYTEQVTMVAGITIQGGWVYSGGSTWSHPCALDASQTVIVAPAGTDRTVTASYDGTGGLDTLTVKNLTTAAAGTSTTPGQSLYGIFASNAVSGQTVLSVSNLSIDVAAGGNGGTGSQGGAGGAPLASCGAAGGGGGGAGGPGNGGGAGGYDITGYHARAGMTGVTGGTAADGTAAVTFWAGDCITAYSIGASYTSNASCCPISGNGCGSCSGNVQLCGTAGTNGCASPPSSGGAGGTGGGASIGLYAYNVALTINAVTITTGSGGAGQNGGPGGTVSAGSNGAMGGPSTSATTTCTTGCGGTCCVPGTGKTQGTGGPAGGPGGTGGVGGMGGGGGGGDSYCYATAGTSPVTGTGATCTAGAGGKGGDQGLGVAQGLAGGSAIHN